MVLLPVRAERAHDVTDREVMNRRIEKGKRGALARTVQRGSGRQLRAALDVAGRQRAQPARQLRSREIGEMTSLERREPRIEGAAKRLALRLTSFAQGILPESTLAMSELSARREAS
jgi:hypothetical protein